MKLQVFLNVTPCQWVRSTSLRPCHSSEEFKLQQYRCENLRSL